MSRSKSQLASAIPLGAALGLFVAPGALAVEASAEPTTSPVFTDPIQLLNSFALLLGFGLIIVLAVVAFVLVANGRYLGAVLGLAKLGFTSSPRAISATNRDDAAALGGGAAPPVLTVTGPEMVVVGRASEYNATIDGAAAAAVTWAASPADAATVTPTIGARVKVVASRPGAFTLAATNGADPPVELAIIAEAPAPSSTILPVIGGGWGSIVVSVAIVTLIAVLGVAGVLGREGIAGLLGTLIGYLFGVRTAATPGAAPADGAAAGGAAAGDGSQP